MLNVDTHILMAWFEGTLRADERRLLEREPWGISAIVFWELYALVNDGELRFDLEDADFNRDLARLHVWPISIHVCRQLRRLDFTSDPADELIAATSLAFNVPLLTRDTTMLVSKVVPLALP
ncbi:MAG: PIN domain-containing protein [Dehalococcoidia bacterium]